MSNHVILFSYGGIYLVVLVPYGVVVVGTSRVGWDGGTGRKKGFSVTRELKIVVPK